MLRLTKLLAKKKTAVTTLTKRAGYSVGLQHGFRSGLEGNISNQLRAANCQYFYEEFNIPWTLLKYCTYTPDWLLHNGIIVEGKGRFVTADRQKHLIIKEQYPDLDIRFVFSRSKSPISKGSKTTYAKWCADKGPFPYADKLIPQAWMNEPPNAASLACIREILGKDFKKQIAKPAVREFICSSST